MRIFNKSNRLFQVEAGAETLQIAPRKLLDLPDKFMEDITYRMAVHAGDIEEIGKSVVSDATLEERVLNEDTPAVEQPVNHPDGLEETEAKRRQDVATGKPRKTRKAE